jgi:hypothetical protein
MFLSANIKSTHKARNQYSALLGHAPAFLINIRLAGKIFARDKHSGMFCISGSDGIKKV